MNQSDQPVCDEEQAILDSAPLMDRRMGIVIRAWFQLASERPCIFYTEPTKLGMAILTRRDAIPWRAIKDWARAEHLSDESAHLLAAVIHYLESERKQQER